MFLFVIRYLGVLKFVPGLGSLFDAWLKIFTLLSHPDMLDWIDAIEAQTSDWPGVNISTHKYGGLQINYHGKEIG
ncbi:MAG TPA: luciferase family protein, partial [Mucilaginibacter sp.]